MWSRAHLGLVQGGSLQLGFFITWSGEIGLDTAQPTDCFNRVFDYSIRVY